jgi:hypothetical protein
LKDGFLRDLNVSIANDQEIIPAYQAALSKLG